MIDLEDKAYLFFSAMELTVKRCCEIVSHYNNASSALTALYNGDKIVLKIFHLILLKNILRKNMLDTSQ